MNTVAIGGIGMLAPGILDWRSGQRLLRNDRASYVVDAELPRLQSGLLSANERRRASASIRVALHCARQAMEDVQPCGVNTVFASSCGDLQIVDKILLALTQPGKPVSPTQFHNSVHNAAAGYWSIACESRAPGNSIAAGAASFSAGLLEAVTQVLTLRRAVLLVAYDVYPPAALNGQKQVTATFGMALLLLPEPGSKNIHLALRNGPASVDRMSHPAFEKLRLANPAARSLPLLQALAEGRSGCIRLPYLPGSRLDVHCA